MAICTISALKVSDTVSCNSFSSIAPKVPFNVFWTSPLEKWTMPTRSNHTAPSLPAQCGLLDQPQDVQPRGTRGDDCTMVEARPPSSEGRSSPLPNSRSSPPQEIHCPTEAFLSLGRRWLQRTRLEPQNRRHRKVHVVPVQNARLGILGPRETCGASGLAEGAGTTTGGRES